MEVLLGLSELQFLQDCLPKGELTELIESSKNNGEYLAKGVYPTGKYLIEILDEQADVFQEELSVLLTDLGIGDDGELNGTGFLIERLIDRIQRIN